ncbi:non-hydrolyzing UDP-N-acetylglucosamine 2-epimerase [Novosphingopyxis sp. YJ-S2-01]|uniref:non-hydrolyzing UDP-N-acetylglucosamine 2-epimerase n=1 Tax=Novosphingopyxis sp. YJ-S2-01 TaxID=2794021 RepID=UPI0018DD3A05|nr:UDP-N-acetylglucosamine 2-epimerase (non-hydrolyzing) [Novosphingopyxis sp. YJ-S2-01]MBH9538477.1 UDP-N-acetylglucosamine 2-epimerase (non-hydrolyzing) [Novosphingopyxis sp. YJ-S2-01]
MTEQTRKHHVAVILGTRPEAIKLFPVIAALREEPALRVTVIATAQHREMLDQVLAMADIVPDHDLAVMQPGQSLDSLTARLLERIGGVLDREKPDRVIVQGDTATAMAGALAAYYRRIPVAHVEAGLRSHNIYHPWPEEVNRKIVGTIADLHFAPTEKAAEALRRENVAQSAIHVTGNTIIDALFATRDRVRANPALASRIQPVLDQFDGRKILLVTTHRRENFGTGLRNIVDSVGVLAKREDLACVIPVHLNPNVRAVVEERLGGNPSIALLEPLDYANFTWLLAHADIVLTDSGGLQEEAPAFDKPVLVMRETTERPEGVDNGTALLVGTDSRKIETEVHRLLDDPAGYGAMASAPNPFGNGKAAKLIRDIVVSVMKG